MNESDSKHGDQTETTRRTFLKGMAGIAALLSLPGCNQVAIEEFLQNHFSEMSPEELKGVLARLEEKYSRRFNKQITVEATPAIPGTVFGYALDIGRCVGCRRCVHACVKENNQSRNPEIQWIKVFEMDKQHGIDFHHATPYYDPEKVPQEGHFYMPVQCQQCEDPPCVKVCPTQATWQTEDGIVVVDYNWCIGCRCCIAACPYDARRFNWGNPYLSSEEVNPQTHYLGNRPRPKGVVEKCTFCIQRVRKGRYPACVEICPVGARKFGNLLDPTSEINAILKTKRVFILKSELATHPKFFYFYG